MQALHVLYSGIGGHSAVVFALLRSAPARADRHHLLFFGTEPLQPGHERWCRAHGVSFSSVLKRPGLDLDAWAAVVRSIDAVRPDVVYLHQPSVFLPVGVAAKRVGAAVVLIEHQSNALKTRRDWAETLAAGHAADQVVYLTRTYARGVEQRLGRLTPRHSVIGNSVDTTLFMPARAPHDGFVFGMHARFVASKDHATMVRAARALRARGVDARVRFAGAGPTEAAVRTLANELDLRDAVEFLGPLDEDALPGFLAGLDAFVLSTDGETMSTALMQAMASGLPCAGSDVPGVRGMITPGVDGELFPRGDGDALAALLAGWSRDPGHAAALGDAARVTAEERFDSRTAYLKYRALGATRSR